MNAPLISCYQTSNELPGERFRRLITPDGTQMAWAARPGDRRGASLIFDGLASTGVDWRVNPPLRVDIDNDRAHLVARLRARGTTKIIITNAHYLSSPIRQVAIDIAAEAGTELVFAYEDGHGTNERKCGLLDDADRLGWSCYPEDEPPFTILDERAPQISGPDGTVDGEPNNGHPADFPTLIATVGFPLFRNWNRQLLPEPEFAAFDRLYCSAYSATLETDTTPEAISRLAQQLLEQPLRTQAITALRGIQAGLFRLGVLWKFTLSDLDKVRTSTEARQATDHDYLRLQQLHDPNHAAIAALIGLGYTPEELPHLRLSDDNHITSPDKEPKVVPAAALLPLQVAADLNDGKLVSGGNRVISAAISALTGLFEFPLPQTSGRRTLSKSALAPSKLHLCHYREKQS